MKQAVQIVTDSSCDLPQQLLKRLRIAVIPLLVHFGRETYHDGELSTEAFWEKAAGPYVPQTSQPPIGVCEELFERLAAQGKRVLCLTLTGKHSGTFDTISLAARRFGDAVSVFDSHSLSLGLGLQVLQAAQAAEDGRSTQEILALLEDLRGRIHLTVVLDTLENVRRGGRADAFIAMADRMTQMLNIKPIVNFVDGQLRLLAAARSFKGGLKRLLNVVEELGPLEQLAVVHARSPQKAQELIERLTERISFPRERIWLRETGAVLASHAGAGAVGVAAVTKSSA